MVLTVIAVIALFPLFYIILASFRTDEEIFKYALPFTIHTIVHTHYSFFLFHLFRRPIYYN